MKFNNKENVVLGGIMVGLGVVGFAINYIKARNVDRRVDFLKEHVETNFMEFSNQYNNHIDFGNKRAKFILNQIEEVVEEVGDCYEHIEVLSKKLDKKDNVEEECNEVI